MRSFPIRFPVIQTSRPFRPITPSRPWSADPGPAVFDGSPSHPLRLAASHRVWAAALKSRTTVLAHGHPNACATYFAPVLNVEVSIPMPRPIVLDT